MLGDAGLLVHSFDGWESPEETWHTKSDLSCSLLHQGQHNPEAGPQSLPIYSAGAGFILRPGATPLLCGKAGDSAGQCGRWCPHVDPDEALDESWRNVAQNGDGCGGSWRPEDFPAYLRRQERWQVLNSRLEHNEIIIGRVPWEEALPGLIDAIFVAGPPWRGGNREEFTAAMETRARFLEAYGLDGADVPLVRMDLGEWHSPVSLLDTD